MPVCLGLMGLLVCGTFSAKKGTYLGKLGWLFMLVGDGREGFQEIAIIPSTLITPIF